MGMMSIVEDKCQKPEDRSQTTEVRRQISEVGIRNAQVGSGKERRKGHRAERIVKSQWTEFGIGDNSNADFRFLIEECKNIEQGNH